MNFVPFAVGFTIGMVMGIILGYAWNEENDL
jgi:hypothetical protein